MLSIGTQQTIAKSSRPLTSIETVQVIPIPPPALPKPRGHRVLAPRARAYESFFDLMSRVMAPRNAS